MINVFYLTILSLILAACATTHDGSMAKSESKDILISVLHKPDLSDKYYQFFEYTIENATSSWKTVQIVDADFSGENTEALTDDNLSAWIEGAELKLKKAQYNQDLLLGSMAAIGGITALSSHNGGIQSAGLVTLAGAAAATSATHLSRQKDKANSGIKGENGTVNVPKTHVFVPSKIAPESYIRRWIVLKRPSVKATPKKVSNFTSSKDLYSENNLISKVKVDGAREIEYITVISSPILNSTE